MKISCVTPKQAKAEAVIVGVVSKDDKRTAPGLARIGQDKHPQATWLIDNATTGLGLKSVKSVPCDDHALVLVGLGDPAKLTQEKLGSAMNAALKHVKDLGFTSASTSLHLEAAGDALDEASALQAMVHGAIIGDLSFDQWKGKSKDKKPKPEIKALQIVAEKPAAVRKTVQQATIIAEAVNDARLLANTPGNIATPKWMASEARKRGRKHGFKVSVKGRAQLRKEGFSALCGVAQGSDNEEQLVTMTYEPEKATKNTKTLVVVGKGVTFDSGGISLKPGSGMWDMKYDKCGACNTIALMAAVAQLKPKHRVIGITPCVENMPSGAAQRPGDIVTSKKGTTIEVLNTDAEGRLILADAIHHATSYKPDWMVDMATLTGACSFAVGETYVAVMSKDDAFAQSIIDASKRGGDKAWQLPQGEEFDEANKGTYADLQNISLSNKAGTSIGGSFVSHFAGDVTFAHLDIASKAWTSGSDYFAKGPTGAGTRIVLQRILDE